MPDLFSSSLALCSVGLQGFLDRFPSLMLGHDLWLFNWPTDSLAVTPELSIHIIIVVPSIHQTLKVLTCWMLLILIHLEVAEAWQRREELV